MIGAIVGDIIGSQFQYKGPRSKDFKLFVPSCAFTDDSVMALAVASALTEDYSSMEELASITARTMRRFGRIYPGREYGGSFLSWLQDKSMGAYGSIGNGSAMRIPAVGWVAKGEEEVKVLSKTITDITHNTEEAERGAEAIAMCIFLARQGKTKEEIRDYVQKHYYSLDFSIEGIRDSYLDSIEDRYCFCSTTCPMAIEAFLESEDFEDAIRLAISLGGDTDTIGAMTGAIAEAFYHEDLKHFRRMVGLYLDDFLLDTLTDFETRFGK